jgi:hypothetical protein
VRVRELWRQGENAESILRRVICGEPPSDSSPNHLFETYPNDSPLDSYDTNTSSTADTLPPNLPVDIFTDTARRGFTSTELSPPLTAFCGQEQVDLPAVPYESRESYDPSAWQLLDSFDVLSPDLNAPCYTQVLYKSRPLVFSGVGVDSNTIQSSGWENGQCEVPYSGVHAPVNECSFQEDLSLPTYSHPSLDLTEWPGYAA